MDFYQKAQDIYYYPPEIANDLKGVPLSDEIKAECFACAWEYARCVIPHYTNWNRYVAFMRTIIVGIIAEFKGHMVDVSAGDEILGFNLQAILDELFNGTVGHELMCREYRAFLLITSEKTSGKRDGELFRRYVNSLADSPRGWFRMRVSNREFLPGCPQRDTAVGRMQMLTLLSLGLRCAGPIHDCLCTSLQ